MTLTTVANGTISPTLNVETDIVKDSSENFKYHMMKIFTDNMQAGDKIEIRIYDWDLVSSSYKLGYIITIQDSQTQGVMYYSPPLPQHRFWVSIKQTLGTARSYDWERLSN